MLTIENREDLERVQKITFRVILSENYSSYENACIVLNKDTLEDRRKKICLKFALKCLKHERLSGLFPLNIQKDNNLRKQEKQDKFKVPYAITRRYMKSPVPYLISLLNEYFSN